MRRLKIVFTTIVALFALINQNSLAQTIEKFKINGLGKFPNQKVYLLYYDYLNGDKVVDSTIVKGNKFTFRGGIEGPSYGGVLFGNTFNEASANWSAPYNIWFTLFEGETNIVFGEGKPEISGSNKGLEVEKVYKKLIREQRSVFTSDAYKADQQKISILRQELKLQDSLLLAKYGRSQDADFKAFQDFLNQYPNDKYALYRFKEQLNSITDYEVAVPLYEKLGDNLKNSQLGVNLKKLIETYKIKEGVEAIPFTQKDVDGNEISLADFKGKYLLIDFWASWCVPCRAENPNVVKAYSKFKNKNFEILGVSLDSNKDNWVAAIKEDGLTWPQVSDLKGWKNEVSVTYGIRAIPSNLLIDPSGKIIAKDLRGEDLEKELEKLIK